MFRFPRRAAAVSGALLLATLVLSPASAKPYAPLIVVSIDGYRADYWDRGKSPTLAALAADGVHAKAMRPAFPSLTSPNHYTLMTGLYPDHHGIVDNSFVDPAIAGIHFGEGEKNNDDPRWWNEATPLWVTAEKAGLKTAESSWPGGSATVQGTDFSYRDPYDRAKTPDQQTDTVLSWLDLPADRRPTLILLHYDPVDSMGHLFGPDTPQVDAAIAQVDAAIAKLVEGLKTRKLFDGTNIVIVSDHGMTAIGKTKGYRYDDIIDLKTVVVTTAGAEIGFDPLPGHEEEAAKILLAPRPNVQCWRKADIPAHLHYGSNARVPAIFCLADDGYSLVTDEALKAYPDLLGNHGYDPADPKMWALFLAHGPAFKSGVTLDTFDNVDVYPLLARILGVKPMPNDGHVADLAPALKRP